MEKNFDFAALEPRVLSHVMDEVVVLPKLSDPRVQWNAIHQQVMSSDVIRQMQAAWDAMPQSDPTWLFGAHMPMPNKPWRDHYGAMRQEEMEARGFDSNGTLLPHRKIWLMAAGLSPDECDELQPYLMHASSRDRVYQLKQGFARPALMGKRKNKHRRGGPPTPPPSLTRFVVGKHLSDNVRTNARVIYDGRKGTFNEEFEAWPT